jgi:hypothetical protein
MPATTKTKKSSYKETVNSKKNIVKTSGNENITHKKSYWIKSEFKKALRLIKQFFSLKLVRILLVLLLIIVITPVVYFFINRPKVQKEINYGVTFSKKYAEEMGMDWKYVYIKALDDLQVKNLRLTVYWDETEPQNDKFNFDDIKWQLEEAKMREARVILTMGRKVPRWPECFEPQWWKDIENPEIKNIELYDFIEQTTLALKGYDNIFMWQVENEPFWPFGLCEEEFDTETIKKEIAIVRHIDDKNRPILVQDSGEGGLWKDTYQLGDYLAISMYRKIWYDFWGLLLGRFVYFQYPLAHWTYKIKANLVGVPHEKIFVTELQAEPWGPGANHTLSPEERDKSMSRHDFMSTIIYAQKAGFKDLYLWGVEWWLWEKEVRGEPFYWDTAKAVFN